jgi:phosphoglycerate dehydrogenase-like enzyme
VDCADVLWLGCADLLPSRCTIVNVGRAEIFDEKDLFDALHARPRDWTAGLDVWWSSPPKGQAGVSVCRPWTRDDCDFGKLPNVVLSPHRGGSVGNPDIEAERMRHLAELVQGNADTGEMANLLME